MLVFKMCKRAEWQAAASRGMYAGSADDLRDGFIHLSTAAQLPETARRYFRGIADLVVVAFEADLLGGGLRWERSRGGDLFPHYYGPLPTALAAWHADAPLEADALPILPEGAR